MDKSTELLLIFGIWGAIAIITILVWIFINPEDDLADICIYGLFWPFCILSLMVLVPFKLLEMLQNKVLERRAKKKYYDEDEYRSENEDWYSEE